jgi:hypothetical protein
VEKLVVAVIGYGEPWRAAGHGFELPPKLFEPVTVVKEPTAWCV